MPLEKFSLGWFLTSYPDHLLFLIYIIIYIFIISIPRPYLLPWIISKPRPRLCRPFQTSSTANPLFLKHSFCSCCSTPILPYTHSPRTPQLFTDPHVDLQIHIPLQKTSHPSNHLILSQWTYLFLPFGDFGFQVQKLNRFFLLLDPLKIS